MLSLEQEMTNYLEGMIQMIDETNELHTDGEVKDKLCRDKLVYKNVLKHLKHEIALRKRRGL
jgi:hypothetical protein